MPLAIDWKSSPLLIVDNIFDESPDSWIEKCKSFFNEKLENEKELEKISWLNETPLHLLGSNQVVKFRGMIQDMFDPEYYMDVYEVKNSSSKSSCRPGRYRDIARMNSKEEVLIESPKCVTGQRNLYYCISNPGETPWVQEYYKSNNFANETIPGPSSSKKRSLSNEEEIESMEENEECNEKITDENKRPKINSVLTSTEKHLPEETLNFPLPGTKGIACILKVYDEVDLRLNDVVEVVGVLSVDPALNSFLNDNYSSAFLDEKESLNSLPPSQVPRLHSLAIKKKMHCNPYIDNSLQCLDFREMRENLRKILEIALLGDSLAADYILAHLVSSVYSLQGILPLGNFSINLSGICGDLKGKNFPFKLYTLLQSLVTQSYFLPLSLENLNNLNFIPKKNYESNKLMSGLLQLPSQLHLFIDGTQMNVGNLSATGVKNLTALGQMINWQKVDYDFQFHDLEQRTDVPVLVTSEAKCLITCDCHLKFEPTNTDVDTAFEQVHSLLTPEALKQIRIYISKCRLLPHTFSNDMQKIIEDDFVNSRQLNKSVTADDLHQLLVLARLTCLTCGEKELTQDIWRSVSILDSERKSRLNCSS